MKIVFVGGGGHCRSCISVAERLGLEVIGILDTHVQGDVLGYPILGGDDWIEQYAARRDIHFLLGVGMVKNARLRQTLFERLINAGASIGQLVAQSAVVSKQATLGIGTVVMEHALVNVSSVIGRNCIINSGAIVEHDSMVGDHTHISTGALVNGGVHIGSNCMIGSGAIILQGVTIADGTVIGAGSTVLRDINIPGTWVGTPARRIEQ
jgi:sugar O-acyltransferase (sialic acid O-acetyltransferase NeuD family)